MIGIGKVDVDSLRKQKLIQYVRNHENNSDKLEFIQTFIKHYAKSQAHNKLRGTLEDEDFLQVVKTIQYHKFEEDNMLLKKYEDYSEIPPFIVLEGELSIAKCQKGKEEQPDNCDELKSEIKFAKGEVVIFNDEYVMETKQDFDELINSTFFVKSSKNNSEILFFDRILWNDLVKKSEGGENQMKLEVLRKCFSLIQSADNRSALQYAKYFKVQQQNKGDVLTTLTSGSDDLFVIQKGRVLLFLPTKKLNKNYEKKFIILQVLDKNSVFNEHSCIFDKEKVYGALVLEDGSNFLHIDKNNVQKVTDADSLGQLRGNCQGKDRLQRAIITKLQGMSNEELLQQQINLCKGKSLDFANIEKYISDSMDGNSKIITHSHLKEREKNIKAFEMKMKNTAALDLKKQNGVLMTPRIVSKDGKFKGLDAQAQLSLLALRSMGVQNRQNLKNQTQSLDQNIIEQQKQELQLDKKDCFFEKKSIKKVNDALVETTSPEKPRSQKKKLSISEEEALIKLGISKTPEELKKEENSAQNANVPLVTIANKPTSKLNMNSSFLNIEKNQMTEDGVSQNSDFLQKKEDKFAAQRKRLLKFGI